ncbi:hypothetical protein GCM10009785_00600 [Brooklawnia cerclae]|uniref:Heme exporter protein D n=1 Tax=Brooklawnia cerclae TaxID=349934 RepID=A0ABX0SHW5_9ACTN|nr:hypothetical protein [Brooklawnia cerclae]NIH56346.1 heme exporter protein D [Brooklawnia cerclae]
MTNRWAFYLMTIASCGVLSTIFWSRGQYPFAVGVAVIAVAYLVRGFILQRRDATEHRTELYQDLSREQTTSEKKAILANLLDTRKHLQGARLRETLGGFVVIIAIVFIYPTNAPLSMALAIFLIPLGYLIVRHTRAITTIERGLAERNLLPRKNSPKGA